MFNHTKHQKKQIEIIDKLVEKVRKNEVSVVSPVKDFNSDPRICLTFLHYPEKILVGAINTQIIKPLKEKFPEIYYYKPSSLHITIKNVRTIENPPNFSSKDVEKVRKVADKILPQQHIFKAFFYRLILFPNSLTLVGTTEPELDEIFWNLDRSLNKVGVPDNKDYANKKYFITNITLARFNKPIPKGFKKTLAKISKAISFEPYDIKKVTLVEANASIAKCKKVGTWTLLPESSS